MENEGSPFYLDLHIFRAPNLRESELLELHQNYTLDPDRKSITSIRSLLVRTITVFIIHILEHVLLRTPEITIVLIRTFHSRTLFSRFYH